MAEHGLIHAYLAELRRELRRVGDVVDIAAEVEDHLREVADWHIAHGMDRVTAEEHALRQFGTSPVVARAFTRYGKDIAMTTPFTRRSGLLWVLAALLLTAGFVLAMNESWRAAWSDHLYLWGAVLIGTGIALLVTAMVGMWQRHGRGLGNRGIAGLVLVGLALPPGLMLTWFTPIWMTLLTVGCLLFAIAIAGGGIVSRPAVALFGAGAVIVTAAMWAGGPLEAFSDRFVWGVPGLAGGAAFVAGCAWLGYALWAEEAADAEVGVAVS